MKFPELPPLRFLERFRPPKVAKHRPELPEDGFEVHTAGMIRQNWYPDRISRSVAYFLAALGGRLKGAFQ